MQRSASAPPKVNASRNAERAARAAFIVASYRQLSGSGGEDDIPVVRDLLADLRHWFDTTHGSEAGQLAFDDAVAWSRIHWFSEAVQPDGFDL